MNLARRMRVIAIELFALGAFAVGLAVINLVVPGAPSPGSVAWPFLVIGAILLLLGGELVSLARLAPSLPAPLLP